MRTIYNTTPMILEKVAQVSVIRAADADGYSEGRDALRAAGLETSATV